MATLYFDGDLRRIYEVPENSSFTVEGGGYRIYTPDNIGTAETSVIMNIEYIVNRFNDFHEVNKWTTLAFIKTGGAFRFDDADSNPVYATADYRLINNWEIVLANYPHELNVLGNLFGDATTGRIFDSARLTAQGVSPNVQRADSLQVINAGLTDEEKERLLRLETLLVTGNDGLLELWMKRWAQADELKTPTTYRRRAIDDNEILVDKNYTTDGAGTENLLE